METPALSRWQRVVWTLLGLAVETSTLAAESDRFAVGAGAVTGVFESEDLPAEIDAEGWAVFGRYAVDHRWGISLTHRYMNNATDLAFDEENSYQQVSLAGTYK